MEILKERMADNLEDIVKCIKPEMIDGITSILKESENLPEKVDALYDKFNNDDTKITKFITELIELVMDDGLISMLHFVNALVIVGEEKYSKMLLLAKVDFDRQREVIIIQNFLSLDKLNNFIRSQHYVYIISNNV